MQLLNCNEVSAYTVTLINTIYYQNQLGITRKS